MAEHSTADREVTGSIPVAPSFLKLVSMANHSAVTITSLGDGALVVTIT